MRRALAGAALAAAAASAAAAQQPLWELGLGSAALRLPHYRGSAQRHDWLLPMPYVVYRGHILKADREGARALLYESTVLDFDLSAGASAPTRSKDDEARRGMSDLAATLEIGPNVNWTLARSRHWKLDLRLPVRAVFTAQAQPRHVGWITTPNLNLDRRVGDWNVGLQAALVHGDRRYNARFYDVLPAEALPERPAYAARSGAGGAQFIGAVSRRFADHWMGAFVKYDTLRGAVYADSPLVRERQQWSVGVAVSWILATSARRVEDAP